MQTKRFIAADMSRALDLVRDEFGEEAMILSTQRTGKGVEIVATLEDVKMPEPRSPQRAREQKNADKRSFGSVLTQTQHQPAVPATTSSVGLASGKTQEELAAELEDARRRMLAMQQQENLTLNEWADRQVEEKQPRANHLKENRTHTKPVLSSVKSDINDRSEQTVDHRNNEEIAQLHEEISSMRESFELQLQAMLATQERQYEEQLTTQNIIPVTAEIKQRLNTLGLSRACNDQVIRSLRMIDDKSLSKETLWSESLARLSHLIPTVTNDPVSTGGIYAFLGTTGVGKTTTIAKLAARYVIENGSSDDVVLLTTDTYRIASHDQLRSLGKILNVHVEVVDDLQQLPQILLSYSKKSLVLIDTPGMGYSDPLFKQHLQALKHCRHLQTCLTLSANSQYQMMQATVHSYRIANPRFCVMTKLDECASLGDSISLLSTNDLPLAYITDGQSVPDDLSIMKPHQLVAKAVVLTKSSNRFDGHANQSV